MVAVGLAFIELIPPISHFLGLGGEFDGLWLMGLPVYALPGGVISGLVFGSTWKWQRGFMIAMVFACLPAAASHKLNELCEMRQCLKLLEKFGESSRLKTQS